MSQDVRDTLRAHGWEPIVDSSGVEQWRSPCSSRACWSIEAAAAQLCSEQSRPSQSANARPCNCDQALKAERDAANYRQRYLESSRREDFERRRADAEEERANGLHQATVRAEIRAEGANCERIRSEHGMARRESELQRELGEWIAKHSAISRILCDLVSAPSLSVAQFADPTLERIRLAMLGRER